MNWAEQTVWMSETPPQLHTQTLKYIENYI